MDLRPPKLLFVWLCSAAFVTVVRALHVADLGYDLTLQIQAEQNLLHGQGLSIYPPRFASDLAEPSQLVTLTYFPAGYSFIVGALMAAGTEFSLRSVKADAVTTKTASAAKVILFFMMSSEVCLISSY